GDDDKSARGSYSITVVIDTAGFTLSGSDTTTFTITKATLDVPTIKSETSIIYTGQPLNLEDYLDGFDPDIMEIIDGGIKTDANNNYVATISLKDLVNCEWKGITSQTVTVNWAIEKAHLTAGWDGSEHVANGQVYQPSVDRFLTGLSPVDAAAVDFANDLLYAGDLNMSAIGAYSITVSLNASAAWTKNYILDGNATWAYVIVPREGMDVITIEWDQTQFTFNGSVQKPNYTVYDRNGIDITAQVASVLTLGGDVNISKWAGDYKAIITVAETSNYFIRSGATCNYSIAVDPVTGEGADPGVNNPGNEGNGGSFIDKLLASHFPLWQVATMAVAGILSLIFVIKAAQYGSRAKKAKGEAKKISSRAYAAFLPIFSTTPVALGLSNKIWSIMAFAFVGLALLLFVVAMIMRSNWKKAELAKENAIDEREQRKYEAQNASQLALQEKIAQASIAGGAGQASDSIAIIEAMRREMDERRREDEARHREEMAALREEQAKRDDAMKMMLANMMGRGTGDDGGFAYASIDDTDMLVQRVIAGLLPAVQQMMPEPTAYLAAPQEQNEELLHIVEEQNAQMQAMSEQMSELQEQLAAMHEMADAVVIQDNNEELRAMTDEVNALRQQIENLGNQPATVVAADNSDELRAMTDELNALREQIANMGSQPATFVAADNSDELKAMSDEMNALREQIANIGSQQVTVVAADNSEDMKAVTDEMNALRAQVAKLSESQLEMSILDDEDDDDFSFDDEEEWDSILDEEDDETFVESVIVEADGTVRKVYPNFRMRLKQSSDKNREWYAAIKNLFCSQKGVTYRVYKRVEKIRYQGNVIAVIGIAKRSIKLWLALKPFEYDARRYHHKDVSDKPRFVDVPLYVRVGSDRALMRAQELILALFQEQSMEARKRYTDRDIQELIFTLKY
ncbi:MAG: hypothetical protein K2N18_01850, partial [Clostridia bacterium]|nr:hypothetical protein [Clostridia bacterium]